jgi:diacylglycerol kinase family enzyme
MAKLALIINRDAGQMRGVDADSVIIAAHQACAKGVEVFDVANGFQDAIDGALTCGADRIAIAGGDGTAVSVLERARQMKAGAAMVPLPLGTANLLPRRLYGERDFRAILGELDQYEDITLPAGQVAGRSFFVAMMAGAPVRFGQAREAMRPTQKGRQPVIAAGRIWQGLRQMAQPRLRLCVDGTETRLTRRSAIISIPGGLKALRREGDIVAGLEHRLVGEGALASLALHSASLMSLVPALEGISQSSDEPARLEGPKWLRLLLDGELVRTLGPVTVSYVEEGGRFAAPKP